MTSPEVEWVLDQLADVVDAVDSEYDATVKRVDRDESEILEDDVRKRSGELEAGCYVGARLADVASDPIGTEYDHSREAVVGVRILGLHHSEYGHVDPAGEDGVPWQDGSGGLVDRVRAALLDARTWPDAGGPDVSYTHLQLANESPLSSDYKDLFRHDLDVVLRGFEEL